MRLPQPSACIPQPAPRSVHVFAVQRPPSLPPTPPSALVPVPHLLAPPPPQNSPCRLVPQDAITPPHPSAAAPQFAPCCAHVTFVHGGVPHWLGTPPPPQLSFAFVQLPHSSTPPQPSPIGPQFAFESAHVSGLHVVGLFDPPSGVSKGAGGGGAV